MGRKKKVQPQAEPETEIVHVTTEEKPVCPVAKEEPAKPKAKAKQLPSKFDKFKK